MKARFTTPAILSSRNGAPALALGGRLFRKEILRAGEEWIHPTTGQIVAFTPADLQALAAESNAYAASQDFRVPFPDGHTFTAEKNLGFWKGFSVEGGSLVGVVEAGDEKVADSLGGRIRDVSAWIESGMKDSKGKAYGPAIRHVCATPEPVIHGSNFEPVALSREGAPVPVYVSATKEIRPMLKILTILALAATATEDDAVKAIEGLKAKAQPAPDITALTARAGAAESQVTALSAKVTALETERADREKAECESSISEVVALAAGAGKPDAFTADDQKLVRDSWGAARPTAKRLLALAKSTIGAPEKVSGSVATKPANKAAADQQAADRLEGAVALARASGAKIEKDASGTYAVRHDGGKIKLG